MNPSAHVARRWWLVCLLLVAFGLAQSAYLLGRVFTLLSGPAAADLCSILFATSCDATLGDDRYWILGAPVAGWGLVYFTALGALLVLARLIAGSFSADALLAGSLLSLAGSGVGLALVASAWVDHGTICPLCLSVHATNLLLAIALWRASSRPVAARLQALRAAGAWLGSSWAGTSDSARWKLVGFSVPALLAIVAFQWVHAEGALRRPPPPDRAAIIAAHRAAPQVDMPLDADEPHLGPLNAPARLVVFESFRCPGCRMLSVVLPRLRARFGDRLLVEVKQYPLSTTCNTRLTRDMQPGACELAWAAEAARRQSQFWRFHDALFAAGTRVAPETVEMLARRLHLDLARFESDRASDEAKQRVAADIDLGSRLKIPGTPAVFLNGRLVRTTSAEALEILIRSDLEPQVAAMAPGRQPATDPARE
jgi:protein-disulfide isomerase/uncharacterized membrane protein